ncbi:hypothetical protein [Methanobrevibacter sp.]|uniref:hypothetical protein n=1 Tax=Methanobrevibacter sp. TaxID=66852 RepID=UPI003863F7B3
MRRKKDDKRVLVSPRDNRQKTSRRQKRMKPTRNAGNKHKRSGRTVFLVILALVAFVIGAGIGISLSFDNGSSDGPHWINVTEEMTTGLNETEPVYYDSNLDNVDFNSNDTLTKLNVTVEPSY